MERGPSWEANISLASQEIFKIIRNPNVYYYVNKSPSCPYPDSG